VQIAQEAVDPADVDLLCDLVLAALHDATAKMQELQAASMGGLGDLLGGAGLDLGDLFGSPDT
jgi:DNA-binding protein YbaB